MKNTPKVSRRNTIIVTGTPGTGKTAISRKLAKSIGADYVSLAKFATERKLYSKTDHRRAARILNIGRTRASIENFLNKTRGLKIIDTHMPEGVVPEHSVKRVFVLRCHPRILASRLHKKKWKRSKIHENVLAEILDACLTGAVECYGSRRVVQLDTSRATVAASVRAARRLLGKARKRKQSIDWISQLDRQQLLSKFLM